MVKFVQCVQTSQLLQSLSASAVYVSEADRPCNLADCVCNSDCSCSVCE